MAVGAIFWMHHMFAGGAASSSAPGAIGVALHDVRLVARRDARGDLQGYHTRVVQISHRYGMILFIASEVMFFVAWFWAYFNTALFPARRVTGHRAPRQISATSCSAGMWPPKGIETFDPWHLPLLNTLILLTSGTTVTWAHHALLENDREGLKWGLI